MNSKVKILDKKNTSSVTEKIDLRDAAVQEWLSHVLNFPYVCNNFSHKLASKCMEN